MAGNEQVAKNIDIPATEVSEGGASGGDGVCRKMGALESMALEERKNAAHAKRPKSASPETGKGENLKCFKQTTSSESPAKKFKNKFLDFIHSPSKKDCDEGENLCEGESTKHSAKVRLQPPEENENVVRQSGQTDPQFQLERGDNSPSMSSAPSGYSIVSDDGTGIVPPGDLPEDAQNRD